MLWLVEVQKGGIEMSTPSIGAVIFWTDQVSKCLKFYRALGLPLEEEKHEEGPLHYACNFGATHVAIYEGSPGKAPGRSESGGSQIAFTVESVDNVFQKLVEMGYLSSEFRGSLTVDPVNNRAVPTVHENFFEFVEREKWENGCPEFLTIDQIELGAAYYVIVTTRAGLYRYFINDVVEFDGHYCKTPTIHFLEKGAGVTSITGEKLHENQVTQAMKEQYAMIHKSGYRLDVPAGP